MWRTQEALPQPLVLAVVAFIQDEVDVEIEPTGADEVAERLEARLDDVALPPGDLGPVLAAPRPCIRLGARATR